MPAKKSLTRTYSGYIPEAPASIDCTFDFYNKGSSFLFDKWLELMGGFSKELVPEKLKDQSGVLCLSFWFTPVFGDNGNKFAFPSDQLKARFEAHWGGEAPPEVLSAISTGKDALNKGVTWIDRRRQFLSGGNKDVSLLFLDPEFVLWGGGEDENSNEYVRSMISRYWNGGEKTDFHAAKRFIVSFKQKVRIGSRVSDLFPIENYDAKYAEWLDKNKKVKEKSHGEKDNEGGHPVIKHFRELLGGKSGSPSSFLKRIHKVYNSFLGAEDYEYLMGGISDELATAEYRIKFEKMPCFSEIKDQLHSHLGVKPKNTDAYCDMFGMFLPGYRSWRSNFINQVRTRHERHKKFLEVLPKSKHLDALIGSLKEEKQPYLNVRQFRGVGKLLKWWEGGNENYLEPLETEKYDWGDVEMLTKLAHEIHNHPDPHGVLELIIEREKAHSDYVCMKHPYINLNNGQNLRLSGAEILFDAPVENHPNARYVQMSLLERGKFVNRKVAFASDRLFREVMPGPNVARNTKLMLKVHGKSVSVNPDPVSLQLIKKGERWYANVSVTVPDRVSVKEACESFLGGDGVSILGIDLGQREAVSFMHLRTNKEGDIKLVSERSSKKFIDLELVDGGSLEDEHLPRRNKDSGKTISRFRECNSPVNAEDEKLWNDLNAEFDGKLKDMPSSRVAFAKVVAKKVKSLAYSMPLADATAWVKRVHRHVTGRFTKKEDGDRKGFGGLTFSRLEYLADIKSAYQAINGRYEAGGTGYQPWIDEVVSKLQTRIVNVRRERVRITANMILKKAIEIDAKLISVENLESLKTSQWQNSRGNKRITNWCATQVIDLLSESAREYGIVVKKVVAAGTSMTDLFCNDQRPRFNKYSVDTDSFKKAVQRLEVYLKTSSGQRAGVTRRWVNFKLSLRDGCDQKKSLKEMFLAEANESGEVLIPENYGKYYPSSRYGWMNSDVHASGVIALRGLKLLLGWYREREGGENDGSKDSAPKSPADKVVRSRVVKQDLSQVATPVPDWSWTLTA